MSKKRIASHTSPISGQFFCIYEDGTTDMFSTSIRDEPDEFYPDEQTFDKMLNALFKNATPAKSMPVSKELKEACEKQIIELLELGEKEE